MLTLKQILLRISPELPDDLFSGFYPDIRKDILRILVKNFQKNEIFKMQQNINTIVKYKKSFTFLQSFYYCKSCLSIQQAMVYGNIVLIFLFHHKYLYLKKIQKIQVTLFKISIGDRDIPIYLEIFRGEDEYYKEGKNGIVIKIFSEEDEIFYMTFFLGKAEIFLSTIQFLFSKNKKYMLLEKYHRISFYIVLQIAEKLQKSSVLSYSNQNHPYSGVGRFSSSAHYDQYCQGIGMILNQDLFYEAQLKDVKLPKINEFLSYNLDKNIIQPFLKQL